MHQHADSSSFVCRYIDEGRTSAKLHDPAEVVGHHLPECDACVYFVLGASFSVATVQPQPGAPISTGGFLSCPAISPELR
jgi:hypothetical protein